MKRDLDLCVSAQTLNLQAESFHQAVSESEVAWRLDVFSSWK